MLLTNAFDIPSLLLLRSIAVSLALVGQLASAYYFQLEIGGMTSDIVRMCLTPVDYKNIEATQALRDCSGFMLRDVDSQSVFIGFPKGDYGYVIPVLDDGTSDSKVSKLLMSADKKENRKEIPCVKVDQYWENEYWNHPFLMTSYVCGAEFLYEKVGTFPVITTTTNAPAVTSAVPTTNTLAVVSPTATTDAPVVASPTTATVATTLPVKPTATTATTTATTKAAKPSPSTTCKGGFVGTKTGKGPNGACCRSSDDCNDTCVKGICGVHP